MQTAARTLAAPRGEMAAHLSLAFVQVCFALFPIFGKFAFENGTYTPLAVGAARIAFGALSLCAIAWFLHRKQAFPPRAEIPRLCLLAILGVAANMTLYLEGLKRSTAVNAGLVMCLIPVFTFVIAALVGQEVFRWPRALGLGVALFGASLLFWAEKPELVREHGLGNALMAVNTLCYATYLVLARPLTRRHPPLAVIAWVFLFSLPWLPLLLWRDHATRASAAPFSLAEVVWPAGASTRALGSLLFILVFPTTLAYSLNAFALSRVRASTTAAYIYVQPLITGAAGFVLLDEKITRVMALSAACIFPGIWLVSRREAPKQA